MNVWSSGHFVLNDDLKTIAKADDTQFMAELAAAFDLSIKTILGHLRQMVRLKSLVGGHLTNLTTASATYASGLASRCSTSTEMKELWNKLLPTTKMDSYRQSKAVSTLVRTWNSKQAMPKRKMTPRKVMVTVWWSSDGGIHHSSLKNGKSITADMYYEKLNTILDKLAHLQTTLVNSRGNSRSRCYFHTTREFETVSKLQE